MNCRETIDRCKKKVQKKSNLIENFASQKKKEKKSMIGKFLKFLIFKKKFFFVELIWHSMNSANINNVRFS